MKHTGILFYVEGEYVTKGDWQGCLDPADENWTFFENADLHPFGKRFFTAWCTCRELTQSDIHDCAMQIVQVIDWLRQERNWCGFDATLWLHTNTSKPRKMFQWEIC